LGGWLLGLWFGRLLRWNLLLSRRLLHLSRTQIDREMDSGRTKKQPC